MKDDSSLVERRRLTAVLSVLAGFAVSAKTGAPAFAASAGAASTGAVSPGNAQTLLVVGDSLSAEYGLSRGSGWVALMERRLASERPGWTVVNASVSGETTAGGASRIDDLLARHRPSAVIVELGGNDALRGLDLAATQRNLERIVATSRGSGAQVLVLGMQIPPNYGRVYGEAFAKVFSDVASRQGVALVPFFLEGLIERSSEFFQADRIHPNAAAQPLMLEAVWPALERLLAGAGQR
jgi:acyl-CoA thioesterase-1